MRVFWCVTCDYKYPPAEYLTDGTGFSLFFTADIPLRAVFLRLPACAQVTRRILTSHEYKRP